MNVILHPNYGWKLSSWMKGEKNKNENPWMNGIFLLDTYHGGHFIFHST